MQPLPKIRCVASFAELFPDGPVLDQPHINTGLESNHANDPATVTPSLGDTEAALPQTASHPAPMPATLQSWRLLSSSQESLEKEQSKSAEMRKAEQDRLLRRKRSSTKPVTSLDKENAAHARYQERLLQVKNSTRVNENVGSISGLGELFFPWTIIPSLRLRIPYRELLNNFGKLSRIVEDLPFLRKDRNLELVRVPKKFDMVKICMTSVTAINKEFESKYMNEDIDAIENTEPDRFPWRECTTKEPYGGADLLATFWDLNRGLHIEEGNIDLFVTRVMETGDVTFEKLAVDTSTAALWLYPVDVSAMPLMKPASMEPLKIAVDSTINVKQGLNAKNYMKFIDRAEENTPIPLRSTCLSLTHHVESLIDKADLVGVENELEAQYPTFEICLIMPSEAICTEMLFLFRTWILARQEANKGIRQLLGLDLTSDDKNQLNESSGQSSDDKITQPE